MSLGGDRVRLVVADNGVGTDVRRMDRRREGHLGLRLVIDRVHNAGGQFSLTSAPGQGTRVEAELPVTLATGAEVRSEAAA
jgi:signal transduction histidine kinase